MSEHHATTPNKSALHAPWSYYLTLLVMTTLLLGGFVPAVVVYLRKSRWWVNPIIQPPEWGNENTHTMSLHSILTLMWIVIAVTQYVVTGGPNFNNKGRGGSSSTVRVAHRVIGYAALVVCFGMSLSAVHLTYENGVAGKVPNNAFALATGTMIMYHIIQGVQAVRGSTGTTKDRTVHVWHMCGLFAWTCFPGFARSLGILPHQIFFHGGSSMGCDVMYTSGWFAIPVVASGFGHYLLQHFVLGPRIRFRLRDYTVYVVGFCVDLLLGAIDHSLLACPDNPLLAQVPGQPWVLETNISQN